MTLSSNLSLYIHIPWCIKKCPYCDFNSHGLDRAKSNTDFPEQNYVQRLLQDLKYDLEYFNLKKSQRKIHSIFFGGGTPSLFSAQAIGDILEGVAKQISFTDDCEITLEANPGAFESDKFIGFKAAGVNRLSIGIQSFNEQHLKRLGRIHDSGEASKAIQMAFDAGFENVNCDLMYALPEQTIEQAISDVRKALQFPINHLSHYQLTLEPNTLFAKFPPPLPDDDIAWQMQEECQQEISDNGFEQYEVSAYSRPNQRSRHNLNYWRFGDYLGIGAGAHGKITISDGQILRTAKPRHPNQYLSNELGSSFINTKSVAESEIAFEYFLNRLRLYEGFSLDEFSRLTGLSHADIQPYLDKAVTNQWLIQDKQQLKTTELGQRFMNDLQALFLAD